MLRLAERLVPPGVHLVERGGLIVWKPLSLRLSRTQRQRNDDHIVRGGPIPPVEDYRAGATIDLAHDRADRNRPARALLVAAARPYSRVAKTRIVRRHQLDYGHFLAWERPAETASKLTRFVEQR